MKKSFIKAALLLGASIIPLVMIFQSARDKKRSPVAKALSEKPFVVVVPSFQASEQNMQSILQQQYENFRVVFIDDTSEEGTYEKIKALVERSPKKDRIQLICNQKPQGSLKNLYTAIHQCDDEEIVVRVEGNDLLAHPFVLKKLNEVYANPEVWLTYGNYLDYPTYKQKPQLCQKFPKSVLRSQRFRQYKWVTSPLHSFYAGLFKKISEEHLTKEGIFLPAANDAAIMLPMLEMAAGHFQFIEEVLYLSNRTDDRAQLVLDRYIRSLPAYQPLQHPPFQTIR